MNYISQKNAEERVLAFLRDLRDLCKKHDAKILGSIRSDHPLDSVGSVKGDEVVNLAASADDAVGTLHLAKRTVHIHLSAEKGVVS